MRYIYTLALLLFTTIGLHAQNTININLEARASYQRDYTDGNKNLENTGFKGDFLNLKVYGDISEHFSYMFRQRLNKMNNKNNFFDATDFLYMNYNFAPKWTISAGKETLYVGGIQYDYAPADLYFCSEYLSTLPIFYAWGTTVKFKYNKDLLLFQICQSPFYKPLKNNDLYAYNLYWQGNYSGYKNISSINAFQYDKGKYLGVIAVGNQFKILDNLQAQIDITFRSDLSNISLKNRTLCGEIKWQPNGHWNIFTKYSNDYNKDDKGMSLCLANGTNINRAGGGIEFFPIKNNSNVRFHTFYSYTFGDNSNPLGELKDKNSFFGCGFTWRIDILKRS